MKAKDVSLQAIVFACVWVGVLFLCKAFAPLLFDGTKLDVTVYEIVASGAFFVVACTPLYRSIWLDKKLGLEHKGGLCGEK